MHTIRTVLATASVFAMVGGVGVMSAGAASAGTAAVPRPGGVTAVTYVAHRHVMVGGGLSALANFRRTVTVQRMTGPFYGNQATGRHLQRMYLYKAFLHDQGTFVTFRSYPPRAPLVKGADARGTFYKEPFSKVHRVIGAVHGRMSGYATFTFWASSPYANAKLVPRFVYGDYPPTATWPKLFFPTWTHFGQLTMTSGHWTYRADTAPWIWLPAFHDHAGQVPWAGNITGGDSHRR